MRIRVKSLNNGHQKRYMWFYLSIIVLIIVLIIAKHKDNNDKKEVGPNNIKQLQMLIGTELGFPTEDWGYCLAGGKLYIVPYEEATTAEMVYGYSFEGNLVEICGLSYIESTSNSGEYWLLVKIDPHLGKKTIPELWLRMKDAIPYNEDNRKLYSGPFEYQDNWKDVYTGEKIGVTRTGEYYSADEINDQYYVYMHLTEEMDIGEVLYVSKKSGMILPSNNYIQLTSLNYPEFSKYISNIIK